MKKRAQYTPKKTNKELLIQYLENAKNYITLEELVKKLQVDIRTVQRYIKEIDQPRGYVKSKRVLGANKKYVKVFRIFDPSENCTPVFSSAEIKAFQESVLENSSINIADSAKKKLAKLLHIRSVSRFEFSSIILTIERAINEKKQLFISKYRSRDFRLEEDILITPVYIDIDDNKVYAYILGKKHLRPFKFESMYGVSVSSVKALDFSVWKIEKEKRDVFTFPYKSSKEVIKVDISFNSFVRSQLIRQFPQTKEHVKPILGSTDHFELKIDVYDIAPIGRFVFGLIGVIKINSKQFKYHLKQYFDEYIKDGIGAFDNLSN